MGQLNHPDQLIAAFPPVRPQRTIATTTEVTTQGLNRELSLIIANHRNNQELIIFLADHGDRISPKKLGKLIPLAVSMGKVEILHALFAHQPEINPIDLGKLIPLAVSMGKLDILHLLFAHGAEISPEELTKLLFIAISMPRPDILDVLFIHTGSIDLDAFMKLVLRASEHKNTLMLNCLLKHGKNRDIGKQLVQLLQKTDCPEDTQLHVLMNKVAELKHTIATLKDHPPVPQDPNLETSRIALQEKMEKAQNILIKLQQQQQSEKSPALRFAIQNQTADIHKLQRQLEKIKIKQPQAPTQGKLTIKEAQHALQATLIQINVKRLTHFLAGKESCASIIIELINRYALSQPHTKNIAIALAEIKDKTV